MIPVGWLIWYGHLPFTLHFSFWWEVKHEPRGAVVILWQWGWISYSNREQEDRELGSLNSSISPAIWIPCLWKINKKMAYLFKYFCQVFCCYFYIWMHKSEGKPEWYTNHPVLCQKNIFWPHGKKEQYLLSNIDENHNVVI